MRAGYNDRDGRPVNRQQWEHLSGRPAYARVDYSQAIGHGRDITVVTFWRSGPDAAGRTRR